MPTSFTTNLRLSNPGLGDTGWGSTVSNGMIDLVDPAIAGTTTLSADTDVILTTANGMADQARQMILNCTGSRAAQRTITAPASSKVYVVINGTTGGFGVKIVGVGPTTGVVVPAGRMAVVAWNGSDFVTLGAVVDLTASGNVTVAGTLGVGTTSPTGAKVVIEGPASAPSVFNALALRNSLDGSVALIFDNNAATTLASIEALITSTGAGTDDGVLAFGTALNGVNAERMRLDASGNLGVGTTSPGYKLDVVGIGKATSSFAVGDSSGNLSGTFVNESDVSKSVTFNADPGNVGASSFMRWNVDSQERMRLDASGNLGLGVTPSAWNTNYQAFQVGSTGFMGRASGADSYLLTNAYNDGAGFKYINSLAATQYRQDSGVHSWFTAPSGTAGNAISFTQAMTLDASGNLGIGTTSPTQKLDVKGVTSLQATNSTNYWAVYTNTDNTFRLNYNAAGTDELVLDSSGNLAVGTSTTTNAKIFSYVNDAALPSMGARQDGAGPIQIWQSSGAIERARITGSGDLLVGTTSSSYTNIGARIVNDASNPYITNTCASSTNAATSYNLYSTGAGAFRFYVDLAGTVFATSTTISAISDQRLKENIRDLDVGLNAVMALKPRKFDWKTGKGKATKGDRGFIAQEFEQVFPDLIDEWKDPAPEGEEPYKSVRADLIPVLVKAMQEQQALIVELCARVAALEVK